MDTDVSIQILQVAYRLDHLQQKADIYKLLQYGWNNGITIAFFKSFVRLLSMPETI